MKDEIKKTSQITLRDGTPLAPVVREILSNRGLREREEILEFLDPKLKDLPPPSLMKDMDIAVKIVTEAIEAKKGFIVWGDYDVDGTTATALLLHLFKALDVDARHYIPNRLQEGYGIQVAGLDVLSSTLKPENHVLITVDNGISAHKAIAHAKELGYMVVVSDHHLPPCERVVADAVLNPNQPGCNFPEKSLAGVGVAFYFAMAIRAQLAKSNYFKPGRPAPNLKSFLDLVAIGTVADMVPLEKVNRILVRAGMETVAKGGNLGLNALCRACGIDTSCLRSEDISFQLAPKINAAGRLGEAGKAMGLFMATERKESQRMAKELVQGNERRKLINLADLAQAKQEHESSSMELKHSVIVVGSYHIGVAGIVASGLVECYQKPSVVLCEMDDGTLKGSARSCPGVDLHLALQESSSALLGFGGHPMAGGMSLTGENVKLFCEMFDNSVKNQLLTYSKTEESNFDVSVEIGELFRANTLRQLHLMEPFGQGNPQPIFRDLGSRMTAISAMGKDKSHLRMNFRSNGRCVKGVAFGLGHIAKQCQESAEAEIIYTPSLNFFRGRRSWQAMVTSITFNSE
jgi:single-stranded-DNA-specific exonuclease